MLSLNSHKLRTPLSFSQYTNPFGNLQLPQPPEQVLVDALMHALWRLALCATKDPAMRMHCILCLGVTPHT